MPIFNELSDHQRDSWHYLLGSILRELGGGRDAIRIVQSVATLELRKIVEAFLKAVPIAGDAVAIADRAKDFATRGRAAARAASYLISTSGLLDEDGRMTALRALLQVSADAGRLSQDLAVDGTLAPPALPTTTPTSLSAHLNARKELIVGDLLECGHTGIRVNQQQVDSGGELVGDNRPDIQATSPMGVREHWVLDGDPTGTGRLHELRILANDEKAVVHVVTGSDLSTCEK